MYAGSPARSAYAASAVRTERASEYAVFARVTSRLKAVDEADRSAFPALAQAVADNQHLWGTLAEFVRRHSLAVLGGKGAVDVLVDINTAIMKGLRGDVEAAA